MAADGLVEPEEEVNMLVVVFPEVDQQRIWLNCEAS
jgi:hypothetical protein